MKKIVQAFAAKGYELKEDQVEQLLAELQKESAKSIGLNKFDEEQLKHVSRGNAYINHTSDDCLSLYKKGDDCWFDAACALTLQIPITTCDLEYECVSNNMHTPVSACS